MLNSFYDPSFFGFFAGIYSSNINNEVIIFNDFFGEKNLFYYADDSTLIVCSLPQVICNILSSHFDYTPSLDINHDCLASYLRTRNLLLSPGTFLNKIKLLRPGNNISFSFVNQRMKQISSRDCWDIPELKNLINNYSPTDTGSISSNHYHVNSTITFSYEWRNGFKLGISIRRSKYSISKSLTNFTLLFGKKDIPALSCPNLIDKINADRFHDIHNVTVAEYNILKNQDHYYCSYSYTFLSLYNIGWSGFKAQFTHINWWRWC